VIGAAVMWRLDETGAVAARRLDETGGRS